MPYSAHNLCLYKFTYICVYIRTCKYTYALIECVFLLQYLLYRVLCALTYMIESLSPFMFLQYSFSPQVLYCFSKTHCPIPRDASYYSCENRCVCVCACARVRVYVCVIGLPSSVSLYQCSCYLHPDQLLADLSIAHLLAICHIWGSQRYVRTWDVSCWSL